MGEATETLARRFGAGVGGLLNATFGNAAELVIALAALRRGLDDIVKASLTGSILGNSLLVLGVAVFAWLLAPAMADVPGWPARQAVAFYQRQIAPAIGDRCSLWPSCSAYAMEACAAHGALGLAIYADRAVREPDVAAEVRTAVATAIVRLLGLELGAVSVVVDGVGA